MIFEGDKCSSLGGVKITPTSDSWNKYRSSHDAIDHRERRRQVSTVTLRLACQQLGHRASLNNSTRPFHSLVLWRWPSRHALADPVLYTAGSRLSNLLRRSQENLWMMTELAKILGKSYDDAHYQNFLRKSYRKILGILKLWTYDKVTTNLENIQEDLNRNTVRSVIIWAQFTEISYDNLHFTSLRYPSSSKYKRMCKYNVTYNSLKGCSKARSPLTTASSNERERKKNYKIM